jgi:outer membrane protein OmpA-like peptidoglycan-associated protein
MPGKRNFRKVLLFLGYSFIFFPFWVSGGEILPPANKKAKLPMEQAQAAESGKKDEGWRREKDLITQARKIPRVTVESVKGEVTLSILALHLFTPGTELTQAGKEVLDQVKVLLRKTPDARIVVKGHTDNTGSEEINQAISRKRANRVREYLVTDQEVPSRRIVAEGLGPSQPMATNATEAGRTLNRRVEIVVLTGK